ncbi:MAG: ParB/RepB/Spo0J family partition protein [bacterium]|nr:ParB/RepB/Spo0J family partition protein [bacterium]
MGKAKSVPIVNQEYEAEVEIGSISPHPRNPNKGDEAAILESVSSLGFYGAVICQKESRWIIVGEHRWKAAKKSKAKTIPVLWVDCNDVDAVRIMLADNRTADLARYKEEEKAALLSTYCDRFGKGFLKGTGYSVDDMMKKVSVVDKVTRDAAKTKGPTSAKKPTLSFSIGRIKFQVDSETFAEWLEGLEQLAEETQREVAEIAAERLGMDICQ